MRHTPRLLRLIGIASLAALNACATMIHGSQVTVPVTSMPTGQRVTLDGVEIGATPMYVVLPRDRSHTIGVGSDSTGEKVEVKRHLSGWVFANFMWLYGLPALYDLGSGGAFNFNLDRVHVTLRGDQALASASWLAPSARIRIAIDSTFEDARAEWARGDSIAWRWPVASEYAAAETTDVHVAKLSDVRMQVNVGRDRPGGGRTGVQITGALTTLGPAVGGVLARDAFAAAVGTIVGVEFLPLTLPLGYAIGAGNGHERWAPATAYRLGLDLAAGDLVRLGDERTYRPITGRLRDLRGDTLVLDVNHQLRSFTRSEASTLQRARGSNWWAGFTQGALIGAGTAFVGQSMCKCKMRQQQLMLVPLGGAFLGAYLSPIFAPRKWVNVAW